MKKPEKMKIEFAEDLETKIYKGGWNDCCDEWDKLRPNEEEKEKLIEKYIGFLDTRCFTTNTETNHGKADDILCELLSDLGYYDVVKKYNDVDKW